MSSSDPQTGSGYQNYGGLPALNRAAALLYDAVLSDDELRPIFGAGRAAHLDHFTMFMGDYYGAQNRYTSEFDSLDMILKKHPGMTINQPQRVRFVHHMRAAAGAAGLSAPNRTAAKAV